MDQRDYSGSQYYQSGQRYSSQTSGSSPYSSTQPTNTSSPTYAQPYPQTSSGSEQGGYDYDPFDGPGAADETAAQPRRRSRGASSTSGSASTSARRREQNRLAQRALRQRRESHIRSLEDRILHTSLQTRHLASENRELSQQLHSVASQNEAMRRESVESQTSAAAWAHQHQHAAVAPAYNPYPPHAGGAHAMGYGGQTSPYHQSSSATDANQACSWPWDDAATQGQYDPRYWGTGHGYPSGYAQQYGRHEGEADEDDEEEEEEDRQPPHSWSRRR